MIEAYYSSGMPDEEERNCSHCRFCVAAVSWWCNNKEAVKVRETTIPGVSKCPFWEPMKHVSEKGWFEDAIVVEL